jgi:hypothetical protein
LRGDEDGEVNEVLVVWVQEGFRSDKDENSEDHYVGKSIQELNK